MCRGAQTRYINIRLRKSRVNSLFPARPSHQKAGHRAIAQVVPRAGVVNARRPGRRPGRSEAKSIDEAEHGASIISAMVARLDLTTELACVLQAERRLYANRFLQNTLPHF